MQFTNLKLYKVTGFFVAEFYLLASSLSRAKVEAKKAVASFRVEEVDLPEDEDIQNNAVL